MWVIIVHHDNVGPTIAQPTVPEKFHHVFLVVFWDFPIVEESAKMWEMSLSITCIICENLRTPVISDQFLYTK